MARRTHPPKTSKCPDCGRPTIAARNPRTGAWITLDAIPHPDGGIILDAERYPKGETPRFRVLTGEERLLHTSHGNPVRRYRHHNATCAARPHDAGLDEVIRAVRAFVTATQQGGTTA